MHYSLERRDSKRRLQSGNHPAVDVSAYELCFVADVQNMRFDTYLDELLYQFYLMP